MKPIAKMQFRYMVWLFFMAIVCTAQAQTEITNLEYYIDTDPGYGMGTSIAYNTASLDTTLNVDLSGVSDGLHVLYVRTQDNSGLWSHSVQRPFVRYTGSLPLFIDRLEYMADTILPPGQGEIFFFTPNATIDTLVTIGMAGIGPGIHTLYFRVRQASGRWSHVESKPVVVYPGSTTNTGIGAVKYFFDNDKGTIYSSSVTPTDSLNQALVLDVSNLTDGLHLVHILVEDQIGRESIAHTYSFVKYEGEGGNAITQVQYFYGDTLPSDTSLIYTLNVNDTAQLDTAISITTPDVSTYGDVYLNTRVKSRFGQWSFYEKDTIEYCPTAFTKAGFETVRFANTFSFIDTSSYAETYHWDFGDGNTDSASHPIHAFNLGNFSVQQVVTNQCGSDTLIDSLVVEGIEYYAPQKAGVGGDAVMTIFGAGLDTAVSIRLIGSETITPVWKRSPDNRELNAYFDFHEATPGLYDVEIIIAGNTFFYADGFLLEDYQKPVITSTVDGANTLRINRWSPYQLNLFNDGNVLANGVISFLAVPADMEVDLQFDFIERDDTLVYTIDGNRFETYTEDYDSIYNTLPYIEIDTLFGEAFNGKLYEFYVPWINPKSTYSLPFKARSTNTGSAAIKSFTFGSTFYGSPPTAGGQATAHLVTAGAMFVLNELDEDVAGFMEANLDLIDQSMFAASVNFNDWLLGTNTFENNPQLAAQFLKESDAAIAKSKEYFTDLLVGYAQDNLQDLAIEIVKAAVRKGGRKLKSLNRLVDKVNGLLGSNLTLEEAVDNLIEGAEDIDETIATLEELTEDAEELTDMLGEHLVEETEMSTIGSFDPNAIYGPNGIGADRYINNALRHDFIIYFENVDTATAAAQIVTIELPLDTTMYDVNTLEIGDFGIADQHYTVERNRKEVFYQFYYEAQGLDVRFNAKLDTVTGLLSWQFLSIDTATNNLVSDPFAGFLPPNVSFPEGEGYVTFSVEPKKALPHNTLFANTANIIFDENKPIVTNTWQNVIDARAPQSGASITSVERDTIINLSVSLLDDESGEKGYYLYVKRNNGPWTNLGFSSETTRSLVGSIDSTYSFYTEAIDNVGNREVKSPMADASVTLSASNIKEETKAQELLIFPNPNMGVFQWVLENEYNGPVYVEIYNSLGQEVHSSTLRKAHRTHRAMLDLSAFSNGVYTLSIKDENHFTIANQKVSICK